MKWGKRKITIGILLLLITMAGSLFLNSNAKQTVGDNYNMPIYSVNREEKVLAITFDINWAENDYIYSILDILDKYNVKATFFIMGGWVNYSEDNVSKLKAISERGHEIGNHSYIHPMFTKVGEDRIKEELKKTDEIIEKYTGIKPKLFRFPSGDYNNQSLNTVLEQGYRAIQWNADSVDWKEEGEEIEYNRLKKKIEPGSIILFHNNAKYTPANLEKLIKEYTNNGYYFTTVSELIYNENDYIDKNGIQNRK